MGYRGKPRKTSLIRAEFLKTINADWFRINVATPLAGSEMYEICETNNYFKDIPILGNYKKAIVETEDFSAEYIQEKSYLMNIELNFVHNANMKLGHYEMALDSFRNVLKAKYDHPVAHYYKGVCHQNVGNHEDANRSLALAVEYANRSPFWRDVIDRFSIPIPVLDTIFLILQKFIAPRS